MYENFYNILRFWRLISQIIANLTSDIIIIEYFNEALAIEKNCLLNSETIRHDLKKKL